MSTFPQLKTNAAAQYPAKLTVRYQNEIHRFVDGSEQRYRDCSGPLHNWDLPLKQLDEGESAAFLNFAVEAQGRFGSFAIADPWSGTAYPNCSLSSDDLSITSRADLNSSTRITVTENR